MGTVGTRWEHPLRPFLSAYRESCPNVPTEERSRALQRIVLPLCIGEGPSTEQRTPVRGNVPEVGTVPLRYAISLRRSRSHSGPTSSFEALGLLSACGQRGDANGGKDHT